MRNTVQKEASKALGAVLANYARENGGKVEIELDEFKYYNRYNSPFVENARCQDCTDYPQSLTERGVIVRSGKEWVYADIDFHNLSALVAYAADA